MDSNEATHVAFSDECQFNIGRYRGIGLISVAKQDEARISRELKTLIAESNVDELKWEKLRNAKYRFAALKAASHAICMAHSRVIRVDVLLWDIMDRRHTIQGRDDIQNLQRMYYHLFRNVLVTRWPTGSTWHLFPDEHTGIDWQNMEDILDRTGSQFEVETNLFTRGKLHVRLRKDFGILSITPVRSDESPGVQLADLFVGLAVYSRASYDTFELGRFRDDEGQGFLPLGDEPSIHASNADVERCRVLAKLDKACKSKKLGVSLKTYRGLRTLDPKNPINFWWYEPQHEADKAPTKGG